MQLNPLKKKRKNHKTTHQLKISILTIFIGLCLLLYSPLSNFLYQNEQSHIIDSYNKQVTDMGENKWKKEFSKAMQYNAMIINGDFISDDFYNSCLNINGDGIMGYIQIEKINVVLPIYHYTRDSSLRDGIGHMKDTSLPIGQMGNNCVLAGHNGMASAKMFTDLDRLEIDDEFELNVLNLKLKYKIISISIDLANNVNSLKRFPDKDIVTLITCTPFGINKSRLIVVGESMQIKNDCIDLRF